MQEIGSTVNTEAIQNYCDNLNAQSDGTVKAVLEGVAVGTAVNAWTGWSRSRKAAKQAAARQQATQVRDYRNPDILAQSMTSELEARGSTSFTVSVKFTDYDHTVGIATVNLASGAVHSTYYFRVTADGSSWHAEPNA